MTTPAPRAGRNLPAALAVAVALASLIILSLVIRREGFVLLAGAAGAVAAWELMNALKNRPGGIRVPVVPTVIGPMVIVWATWFAGGSGAALAAVGMLVLQVVWRAYRPQREDVEDPQHPAPTGLPRALKPYRDKLYGLWIDPERLHHIRSERRRGSSYAALPQVSYELRQAEGLYKRHGLSYAETTNKSIEEIATLIMQDKDIRRRSF